MEFAKLSLNNRGYYSYQDASNVEMNILATFLTDDIRCSGRTFFKDWLLSNENAWAVSGNATVLEKEGDYIYMTEEYSVEEELTEFKIGIQQLVKLIDDWNEKVCKLKPKEVIIKHENGEFIIETKE